MRSALAVCLLCCVGSAVSAPNRRGANEILIGEVDIAMRDGEDDGGGGAMPAGDDDSPETSTEQPFAKKCIVDNKAYSHSQMIPWTDSSSHCLCVAGEVYCWWQKYVGSKSRSSNNPMPPEEEDDDEEDEVEEDVAEDEEDEDDPSSWTTEEESDYVEGPSESPEASGESALLEASGEQQDDQSNSVSEEEASAPETLANSTMSSSTTTSTTTTTKATARPTRAPATCLVMGRKYQEGEVLPHSTGNCVECSCGSEGRIECSPRDCVGLRPQSVEAGAVNAGDFELFDFEHERGIEESF